MPDTRAWINIQPVLRDKVNFKYVQQMEKRMHSLLRQIPHAAAMDMHEALLGKIPNKATYKELRKSLNVFEVPGRKGKFGGFAVYAKNKAKKTRKTKVSNTVIYVRVKKIRGKVNPAVQILEDMGPWTEDTIPFHPDTNEATLIKREDKVDAVTKIAKKQLRQKSKVRRLLMGTGVSLPPKKGPGQLKRKQGAITDMIGAALSLEFGGETKAVPAWRQGIKGVKKSMAQMPKRHKGIYDTWFNAKSTTWKRGPKKKMMSKSDLKEIQDWQKRLGY